MSLPRQQVNTTYDGDQKQYGALVVGVRIDTVPEAEAGRLAGAGKFHPLTLDKSGQLRVVQEASTATSGSNSDNTELVAVLLRIEALQTEVRDILLRMA